MVASLDSFFYLPASKASREVANLIGIKNPHTHVYGVKEFLLARGGSTKILKAMESSVVVTKLFKGSSERQRLDTAKPLCKFI